MLRASQYIVTLALACACLFCGCSSGTNTDTIVVFSDVHFNPFYDTTLFNSLNAANASEWNAIFQTSTISEPSAYGADSNYPLLVLALSSIQQNLGTSPVIIYTGDVLGHNFAQTYFNLSGSEDVAAMENFASKTLTFFTQLVKSYVGNIPVMFVLGNADSYTGLVPDSTYFANTADIYYSNWISTTIDQQTFLSTYLEGGYYSAEPIPGLVVVALNIVALALYPVPMPPDIDSQVQPELDWLDSTLATAKSAGKKVWLLMHVPPGTYTGETVTNYFDPTTGQLSGASMTLQPNYQTSLLQILSEYSGTITMMLGAHTHMDEFRNIYGGSPLSSSGNLMITPGITPYFDNNPAYRVFTFLNSNFEPTNYRSIYYNLATLPAQFDDFYTFSTAYFNNATMSGLLNDALTELYPTLNTDTTKQGLFRTYYYSGSSYSSAITDANWKVYWCAIVNMAEQDLINCVNSL